MTTDTMILPHSTSTGIAPAERSVLLAGPAGLRHEAQGPEPVTVAIQVAPDALTVAANTAVVRLDAPMRAQCRGLAPLFLLRAFDGRWTPYTQQSFTGDDVLFVVLPGPTLTGDLSSANQVIWTGQLAERHRACGPKAVNHQRWFVNALPGQELEYKFTLQGQPDLWRLTTLILDAVRDGGLQDWICEHGNNGGFEQWDFDNHLFEITTPRTDRGYIAFIPAVNGTWIIRRKRFIADAEMRHEDLIEGVVLGPNPDLPAVIADRWGLRPAWGEVYRRVRYNVLLESLASGHVFSIMLDRCTDRAGLVDPLHQVEVEYVRTRTLRPVDFSLLHSEYEQLVAFSREFLASHGVASLEDHWSKLSWLRPAAGLQST
ncbi:hypothetical protein [Kribbella kalugense]|uniref:Uncharacterized protein n=1 Tax=Kribbella kalugense TaxID=2512221 RepID=A0A4R7ZF98_9ACTN|nr:hypothetical protein [Kribbella kalugense]TDW15646.1 hypothetical protein EV650_7135 [Kribbella kalugense]